MESSLPWIDPGWQEHTRLLLDSYCRWVGRELIDRKCTLAEQARTLFEAPFVVVAHGNQADPILGYGNAVALKLWEMDLESFLETPSRLTAEPMHRDERARLLERTTRDGYVDDYQGIRISRTGRRFRIDRAVVWNVMTGENEQIGQAATFAEWKFL